MPRAWNFLQTLIIAPHSWPNVGRSSSFRHHYDHPSLSPPLIPRPPVLVNRRLRIDKNPRRPASASRIGRPRPSLSDTLYVDIDLTALRGVRLEKILLCRLLATRHTQRQPAEEDHRIVVQGSFFLITATLPPAASARIIVRIDHAPCIRQLTDSGRTFQHVWHRCTYVALPFLPCGAPLHRLRVRP